MGPVWVFCHFGILALILASIFKSILGFFFAFFPSQQHTPKGRKDTQRTPLLFSLSLVRAITRYPVLNVD